MTVHSSSYALVFAQGHASRGGSQPLTERGRLVPGRHGTPLMGNSPEALTNLPWTAWLPGTPPANLPSPSPSLKVTPALPCHGSPSLLLFLSQAFPEQQPCVIFSQPCLCPSQAHSDCNVSHLFFKEPNVDDLQSKGRGIRAKRQRETGNLRNTSREESSMLLPAHGSKQIRSLPSL